MRSCPGAGCWATKAVLCICFSRFIKSHAVPVFFESKEGTKGKKQMFL